MRKIKHVISGPLVVLLVFLYGAATPMSRAQDSTEQVPRHLYRPHHVQQKEADTTEQFTSQTENVQDDTLSTGPVDLDSLNARLQYIQDSIQARLKFIQDSIQARLQFIEDSIRAREIFVRDSIARHQRILDSLNFYLARLPRLLDATYKAYSDEIIFRTSRIRIVGDSMLSDYENVMLTFDLSSPFTPWKSVLNLSTRPPEFTLDPATRQIIALKAPSLNCHYTYGRNDQILVIRTKNSVLSTRTGKMYKEPIDTVFFDRQGRVVKVKKYFQYYNVVNNYQRGSKLFLYLAVVKQFTYNSAGEMTLYELTNFCDRSRAGDPQKVCNIITYTISPRGNTYLITRKNNPDNEFSDGVFTYEFTSGNTLASVAFENVKKSESWKTIIEVNEDGYVSRYLYQNKGAVHKTLLINYYLDDPRAKHKVETITCLFEDDGISYYQKNNTTGRSRERDKMTLEWSDWH